MNSEEVKMMQAIIQQWIDSHTLRYNWMKENYPDVEREFQDFRRSDEE